MRYGNRTRPGTQAKAWLNGPASVVTGTPSAYQRPTDWLDLPTVTAGEQKVVGLCAVFQDEGNYIAFTMMGNYTVDWGDGSAPQNYTSNVRATHALSWSGCASSTLTSEGFRQAIVTVTMQSGQTFTSARFDRPHTSSGNAMTQQPWLDMRMAGASVTHLGFGDEWMSDSNLLQRFEYVGTNDIGDISYAFHRCRALRQVVALDTSAADWTSWMFHLCGALISLPALNLGAVIDASRMFNGCNALAYVPAFTANTTTDWDTDNDPYGDGWFKTRGGQNALRHVAAINMSRQFGVLLDHQWPATLASFLPTGMRTAVELNYSSLDASKLNALYTSLATLTTATKTVTGAVASVDSRDFESITYTTSTAHGYVSGQAITVTGASPSGYNIANAFIVDVPDTTHVKVRAPWVATPWSSGGTLAQGTYLDVTGNPGASSDTPSIATGKGWTVIG